MRIWLRRAVKTHRMLAISVSVSSCLLATGDAIEQKLQRLLHPYKTHSWQRTGRMVVLGLGLGPMAFFWYRFLDRKFHLHSNSVAKKILCDQLFGSPSFSFVYIVGLSQLEGNPLSDSIVEFKDKFPTLYMLDWMIWPPCQTINFLFIPSQFRAIYVSAVDLVWYTINSYIKHESQRKAHSTHAKSAGMDMFELMSENYFEATELLKAQLPKSMFLRNGIVALNVAKKFDLFQPKVYVDQWPNPNCYAFTAFAFDDCPVKFLYVYTVDNDDSTFVSCLHAMDQICDFKTCEFMSFPLDTEYQLYLNYFKAFGQCWKANENPFYAVESSISAVSTEVTHVGNKFNLTLGSVDPSEAELVDSLRPHRQPGGVEAQREKISRLPSVAYRNDDGKLVAFILLHQMGFFSHMFTVEELRGLGLQRELQLAMAKKAAKVGLTPVGYFIDKNVAEKVKVSANYHLLPEKRFLFQYKPN